MKNLSLLLLSSFIFPSAFAGSIRCSNAPAVVWGEYYCIYADFKDKDGSTLTDVHFGRCIGSTAAGEEEESEIVTFESVRHDEALRATSAQWKKAYAYDVSSPEFGKTTIYMMPKSFKKNLNNETLRVKTVVDDVTKNVNLSCVVQLEN